MDVRPKKKESKTLPYKEIFNLKKALAEKGVKFSFHDDSKGPMVGYQIIIPFAGDKKLSVVQHKFSKGSGYDLLEAWVIGSKEDSVGFLNTKRCIEYIEGKIK